MGTGEGLCRIVSCWVMRNSAGAAIMFTQTFSRTVGEIYWRVCGAVSVRSEGWYIQTVVAWMGEIYHTGWVIFEQPVGRVQTLQWPISKLFPSVCLPACKHTSPSASLELVLLSLFTLIKNTYFSLSVSSFGSNYFNWDQRSTQNGLKFEIWQKRSMHGQFSCVCSCIWSFHDLV